MSNFSKAGVLLKIANNFMFAVRETTFTSKLLMIPSWNYQPTDSNLMNTARNGFLRDFGVNLNLNKLEQCEKRQSLKNGKLSLIFIYTISGAELREIGKTISSKLSCEKSNRGFTWVAESEMVKCIISHQKITDHYRRKHTLEKASRKWIEEFSSTKETKVRSKKIYQ